MSTADHYGTGADWLELPAELRSAVEGKSGSVLDAEPVTGGRWSDVAARLRTREQVVFIKGLRDGDPRVWSLDVEASLAGLTAGLGIAPGLLWRVRAAGWYVLGYEHLAGHHANYAPGSPDLPKMARTLASLGQVAAPRDLISAASRWGDYLDRSDLAVLDGDRLVHTDLVPENVIMTGDGARLVDWSWSVRGPGWMDPAFWVVRLLAYGHTPAEAEALAFDVPGFSDAPADAVTVFAAGLHQFWEEVAQERSDPGPGRMVEKIAGWVTHRISNEG